MIFIKHHLVMILVTTLVMAIYASWWRKYARSSHIRRIWLSLFILFTALSMILEAQRFAILVPPPYGSWLHSMGLAASLIALMWWTAEVVDEFLVWIFTKRNGSTDAPPADLGRREMLHLARKVIYAAPVVTLGYGTFIERRRFQTLEIDLPVAGLHKDLEGLRMVQITDLHMGAYLSHGDMEHIVGMANETKAHLAIMTGDLITALGDPVDDCIRYLTRVKADAGMIGCLGNHEEFADIEDYVQKRAAISGIDFLRSQRRIMEFRGHKLNFAGVDYQTKGQPYLVNAEQLIVPGMPNILLSHNPDVFPVAADKGFAATLSGHTHGGQITVEYVKQYVNPARFYTRYVSGFYREGNSSIYVSRGLGTVGLPVRLGATPELTVIRLRAV